MDVAKIQNTSAFQSIILAREALSIESQTLNFNNINYTKMFL